MITIKLSAPPVKLANARLHWTAKYSKSKHYIEEAMVELLGMKRSWGVKLPLKKCKWKGHLEVGKLMDWDNLVSQFKWPIDALKKAQVIQSDAPGFFDPLEWPTQEVTTGTKYVYLTLEDDNEKR